MVIGWDPLVLKHLVQGDIPEEAARNPVLRNTLRNLRNLEYQSCPATYAQFLTDQNGKATTPKHLLKILDLSDLYLEGLGEERKDIMSLIFSLRKLIPLYFQDFGEL